MSIAPQKWCSAFQRTTYAPPKGRATYLANSRPLARSEEERTAALEGPQVDLPALVDAVEPCRGVAALRRSRASPLPGTRRIAGEVVRSFRRLRARASRTSPDAEEAAPRHRRRGVLRTIRLSRATRSGRLTPSSQSDFGQRLKVGSGRSRLAQAPLGGRMFRRRQERSASGRIDRVAVGQHGGRA